MPCFQDFEYQFHSSLEILSPLGDVELPLFIPKKISGYFQDGSHEGFMELCQGDILLIYQLGMGGMCGETCLGYR
jgi:hypothetical protein